MWQLLQYAPQGRNLQFRARVGIVAVLVVVYTEGFPLGYPSACMRPQYQSVVLGREGLCQFGKCVQHGQRVGTVQIASVSLPQFYAILGVHDCDGGPLVAVYIHDEVTVAGNILHSLGHFHGVHDCTVGQAVLCHSIHDDRSFRLLSGLRALVLTGQAEYDAPK